MELTSVASPQAVCNNLCWLHWQEACVKIFEWIMTSSIFCSQPLIAIWFTGWVGVYPNSHRVGGRKNPSTGHQSLTGHTHHSLTRSQLVANQGLQLIHFYIYFDQDQFCRYMLHYSLAKNGHKKKFWSDFNFSLMEHWCGFLTSTTPSPTLLPPWCPCLKCYFVIRTPYQLKS